MGSSLDGPTEKLSDAASMGLVTFTVHEWLMFMVN